MVKLIARISKGSRMDQIYLPKSRPLGFPKGGYVEISPIKKKRKPIYLHKIKSIDPIKVMIIREIFDYFDNADNVIIAGSFLERGFSFKDIDVVVIDSREYDSIWKKELEARLGADLHIILIDRKSLREGLRSDPLFQLLLSRYAAKKREIFAVKNHINYKILDLHLLTSRVLIDDFDVLAGSEKYKLVRNMAAIRIFLRGSRITEDKIEKEVESLFGKGSADAIKENLVKRKEFLKKFKKEYRSLFDEILRGMKNAEQK